MNLFKLIGLFLFATAGFAHKPIYYHGHDHSSVASRSIHNHVPATNSRIVVTPRQQNALNLHGHHEAPRVAVQNTHNHSEAIVSSRSVKRQPLSARETHHGHQG